MGRDKFTLSPAAQPARYALRSITGASPATATRDLADLVAKNALVRAGERRHTHYTLAIPLRLVASVAIDGHGNVV